MRFGMPWFGPKTGFGWGWTPVTWQGWALTIVLLAAVFGLSTFGEGRGRGLMTLGLVAGYMVVVVLTGTKPGGRLFG
jgi:hypothetical protein